MGVVAALTVTEGDSVAVGDPLAVIRVEQDGPGAQSPAELMVSAIRQQSDNLAAQIAATERAARAQISQLAAQREGLIAELGHLRTQITTQNALTLSAQRDLDRARAIAERGFLSGRELQSREEALLMRQQSLAQLEQALAAKSAALTENKRSIDQIVAQASAQTQGLAAARAQVVGQEAGATGERSYTVNRRPIGTPYRRAKGTPLALR